MGDDRPPKLALVQIQKYTDVGRSFRRQLYKFAKAWTLSVEGGRRGKCEWKGTFIVLVEEYWYAFEILARRLSCTCPFRHMWELGI